MIIPEHLEFCDQFVTEFGDKISESLNSVKNLSPHTLVILYGPSKNMNIRIFHDITTARE